MDFCDWAFESPEQFGIELASMGILHEDPDLKDTLAWDDCYFSGSFLNTMTAPSTNSSFSSPESSESSNYAGPSDGSVLDEEHSAMPKPTGRPRHPTQSGRDAILNRIQRRRTQNRNSQRVYRQRRIEERNLYQTRAEAAEKESQQLGTHLSELQSFVISLRYRVQKLEAENLALRSSKYSMPWRRASPEL